jgi:hypothetical protein
VFAEEIGVADARPAHGAQHLAASVFDVLVVACLEFTLPFSKAKYVLRRTKRWPISRPIEQEPKVWPDHRSLTCSSAKRLGVTATHTQITRVLPAPHVC